MVCFDGYCGRVLFVLIGGVRQNLRRGIAGVDDLLEDTQEKFTKPVLAKQVRGDFVGMAGMCDGDVGG